MAESYGSTRVLYLSMEIGETTASFMVPVFSIFFLARIYQIIWFYIFKEFLVFIWCHFLTFCMWNHGMTWKRMKPSKVFDVYFYVENVVTEDFWINECSNLRTLITLFLNYLMIEMHFRHLPSLMIGKFVSILTNILYTSMWHYKSEQNQILSINCLISCRN